MKKEELLELGLNEEQANKILAMNGKDIERHKKAAEDAKADKEAVEKQLADRDKDIEALKALDADGLKKQLEDLQTKYNTETEQYKTQLSDRDYSDALTRAIAGANIKFSSKAAEKAFIADLKANRLELKDGALQGFEDYHKAQMEADPAAFQSDTKPPVFTKNVGPGSPPAESKGAMYAKQFNAQYYAQPTKE